nr:hypothetical protein [Tanacetum cinerariifolium]
LWEKMMMKPDHQDPNALDNTKLWKWYCFHKFIMNSYYGKVATKRQSLELFYEFYSTYEFDAVFANDEFQTKKVIMFRVGGHAHSLTLLEFARRLGLYHVEEVDEEGFDVYFQGCLCSDDHFNTQEYWLSISREENLSLSRSQASTIRSLILRVIHKMITYGLCKRTTGIEDGLDLINPDIRLTMLNLGLVGSSVAWHLTLEPLTKGTVYHQEPPNSLRKSATSSKEETRPYTKLGNGPIPGMTPVQALTVIQTMADHTQKWHDGSSNRSIEGSSSKGIAAIMNKLENLGRDMKKLKENVHAIQVGCQTYEGAHLDKDYPLKEEVKSIKEAKYSEFGRTSPFSNGAKYCVGPPRYYTCMDNRLPVSS